MGLRKPVNKVANGVIPDTGYMDNTVLGEGLLWPCQLPTG